MFNSILKRNVAKPVSIILCICFFQAKGQSPVTPPAAYSTGVNKNYVRTWDAAAPITDPNSINTAAYKDVKQVTNYFDGLARPMQTVVKRGSFVTDPNNPTSSVNAVDFVTATTYDEFGRKQYQYLPFAANSTGGNTSINDGLFKLNPFQQQATFAASQYPGESFFYAKTVFESSPVERMLQQYAPGDSWVGSESNSDPNTRRSVNAEYLFNDADDSVRVWTISGGLPVTTTTYSPTQLYENIQIDEHKNKFVEYKNKEGRIILKKMQISSSPTAGHYGWLCTYYLYDDAGLLRFVLQPLAVEELLATNWTVSSDILNELAFKYEYDDKQRMIVKKVPGAGEVRMVYDQWDRLVLTQDANLRASNKWLFTKYDHLNRPIMTGFYVNNTYTTQGGMQTYLDGSSLARYETYQTASFPLYSLSSSFPAVSYTDVLTITYYDDYSWAGWYGSYATKDNTWDAQFATPDNGTWSYPQTLTQSAQTTGYVTGVWDKTSGGLLTANYYDDKGGVIQSKTYNHTGGIDIQTMQYSFSGQPLQTVLRHEKGGTNTQTHLVQTRLSYDEAGRLIKTEKKLNSTISSLNLSEPWHATATFEYDALRQLKKKKLAPGYGTNGLDTLANTYNIRGWLTAINKGYITGTHDAWFGMELGYDKDGYATYSGAKQYNGNITGTIWRTRGDGEKRKYDFSYDAVNRLMKADFTQQNGSSWDINEGIDFSMKMGNGSDPLSAYDANGNIKKMWQRGWKLGGSVTIDSLIYQSYSLSNKLKFVRDGMNDPNTVLSDFKEPAQNNSDNLSSNTADYSYDGNGNLIVDNNKAISSISYNHLNLPSNIAVTSKGTIEYVYDAGGTKLKKIVHETGQSDKTTLYVGGFVYENDTLQLLLQEEGRIRLTINTSNAYNGYAFDYFEKDHLGNVRVVLTEQRDTALYPEASMETGNLGRDSLYYSKVPETRVDRTAVSSYPTNDSYTNPNDFVAQTNGSGHKIGPGIVLKVMTGDKVNLRVSSWYKTNGSSIGSPVDPINDIVAALIAGISGGGKFGSVELQNSNVLSSNINQFLGGQSVASDRPKAYLNWILLDEQLEYVSTSSGFQQVPAESVYNNASTPSVYLHEQNGVVVNKNGYLYIYVSNATPGMNVYFDNLQVTHFKGQLWEETHYYPWGLVMSGISSRIVGKPGNKYKYNGKEKQAGDFIDGSGLEWLDYGARMFDNQIGRWTTVDPLASEMVNQSPYNFSFNNPVNFVDVDGRKPLPQTSWTHEGLRQITSQFPIFNTLEKRASAQGFIFKKEDGSFANPVKSSEVNGRARTAFVGRQIQIGADHNNIEAAVLYAYELKNAGNAEMALKLKQQGDVGKLSKEEFVNAAISSETEALITAAQIQSQMGGIDVVAGDNKALMKKIASFEKKYLKDGELITDVKVDATSKQGKALKEIYDIAKKTQTALFSQMYGEFWEKNYGENYRKRNSK